MFSGHPTVYMEFPRVYNITLIRVYGTDERLGDDNERITDMYYYTTNNSSDIEVYIYLSYIKMNCILRK